MKFTSLVLLLVSFSALAHFKMGTYKGVTPEGTECTVKFESVAFTTAFKNPLSEQVTVKALDKTFVLMHPVKIDQDKTSVLYNEESLEVTLPFQGGAEFFQVVMSEIDDKEGPDSFHHLTHDWKKNKVTKVTCSNLAFQEE